MSKPLPEWCSTGGDPNAPWPGRCGVPAILASVPGIRAELFHRLLPQGRPWERSRLRVRRTVEAVDC